MVLHGFEVNSRLGGNTFNKGGVSVWTDEMNRTMQRKRRARSDEAETNARSVPFRINQAAKTMLALKKKREAEAKAKAAAAAAGEPSAAPGTSPAPAATKKVSLLGIGGKKKKDNGGNGKGSGKRRTPGEIRIQKGELYGCYSRRQ